MEFRFDYLECQNCEKKDFCGRCEADLVEKLLLEPEIRCVTLQMPDKTLAVSSELELPELEKLLRKYEVMVH